MDALDDHELLVAARRDPAAFAEFYRRHARTVHAYFRRQVHAGDVAFDLTAETFAAALASVDRYQPGPEPPRAWLFAIARHALHASLRRARVQDRVRRRLAMEPVVRQRVSRGLRTMRTQIQESPHA